MTRISGWNRSKGVDGLLVVIEGNHEKTPFLSVSTTNNNITFNFYNYYNYLNNYII